LYGENQYLRGRTIRAASAQAPAQPLRKGLRLMRTAGLRTESHYSFFPQPHPFQSAFSDHATSESKRSICSFMAPPNKRQRQLKAIYDTRRKESALQGAEAQLFNDELIDGEPADFFFADMMQNDSSRIQDRMEDLLKWKTGAGFHLRAHYTGDSRTTKYRRRIEQAKRHEIVAGNKKIDEYFSKVHTSSPADDLMKLAISKLEAFNLESNNKRKQVSKKGNMSDFDLLRYLAVLRFLRLVERDSRSRVESSELVACVVFGKDGGSYRSRAFRD
jgi:hypothetical protein